MWYFTWILGIGAALAFGIINVMWLEASYTFGELDESEIHDRFSRSVEGDEPEGTQGSS
jgi:cyd operon protein YbgT